MQVLYISQYYPPEACAPAARVDCFTREWVRAGAEVRVLTGFPNHPEGILHAEYRKLWRHGFVREEREGVKVYRTWLYPSANRKLWGRGANFTSFALSAAVAGPLRGPAEWRGHRHLAPDSGRGIGVGSRNPAVPTLGVRGEGPLAGVASGSGTGHRRLPAVPKRGAGRQFPLSARHAYCRGW